MEWETYMRALLSLVFVLSLICGVAWLIRRLGLGTPAPRIGKAKRRLAVIETLPLDNRRRLILVRRDDIQHLILIGGASDLIVESGVAAPSAAPAGDSKGGDES